jgi:hypothetical protein
MDTVLSRRKLMVAAGVGAMATGIGALPEPVMAAASKPSAATNTVNLFVLPRGVTADADGRAMLVFTVGNFGPNPTTGPSALKVVTPFFVNFDRDGELPPDTELLYENSRPEIPEILRVMVGPGLAPGEPREIRVPVILLPGGPHVPAAGRGIFTTAAGSPDVDTDLTRNVGRYGIVQPMSPTSRDGTVSLYFRPECQALHPNRRTLMPFHFGNAGPCVTRRQSTFMVTMPFYVNVDISRGLPDNVELLYQNSDPAVPEVVRVTVPAGLGRPGTPEPVIAIPFVAVPGAPNRVSAGSGMLVPDLSSDSPDIDPDPSSSHHAFGVVMLTR